VGLGDTGGIDMAYRVVADQAVAVAMASTDGQHFNKTDSRSVGVGFKDSLYPDYIE